MKESTLGSALAMWETAILDIELEKGEAGLGFSILDYQVTISCGVAGLVLKNESAYKNIFHIY